MSVTLSAPSVNGRAQKTLSHQLDRLDHILDGFAEALNESVADAIRQAVKQAVREVTETVVRELANRPELQATARVTPRPVSHRLRSFGQWVARVAQAATNGIAAFVHSSGQSIIDGVCRLFGTARQATTVRVVRAVTSAAGVAVLLWRLRRWSAAALTGGLAMATVGYFTGPAVAAALNGLAGTALGLMRPLLRLRKQPEAQAMA